MNKTERLNKEERDSIYFALDKYDDGTLKHLLHKAIITVLLQTGIRKGALVGLKWRDFQRKDMVWSLKIKIKGSEKPEFVPLREEPYALIREYQKRLLREGLLDPYQAPDTPIFMPTRIIAKTGEQKKNLVKHLNPSTINWIVKHWSNRAGVFKNIVPHSTRKTFINNLLEADIGIKKVAKIVHHKSIRTTEVYVEDNETLNNSPLLDVEL